MKQRASIFLVNAPAAVLVFIWIISTATTAANGQEEEGAIRGHDLCPCLPTEEIVGDDVVVNGNLTAVLGDDVDLRAYGTTCAAHDAGTPQCSDATDCERIVPLPRDCEKSWCSRAFCFVDPDNCELVNSRSPLFEDRYYSYATCGYMDSFTFAERLSSLEGKELDVGFLSNTGGWKGSYNPNGTFAANDQWYGPMFRFAEEGARAGGFTIKNTRPPDFLREEAVELFGHNSVFDLCVYATALGYLDFCVGSFTISDRRSSVTTFYEMTSGPLYLIVFADEVGKMTWESFRTATLTIFQPFTRGAWLMIWLFALPLLGLLMLLQEYGMSGSAYGEEEPVLVTNNRTGARQTSTRRISIVKHCPAALYRSALAFFQGSYDLSVITAGGKIALLAIAAFIMLVLAIYTANLAAILTQNLHKPSVETIDEALAAGYNFCAERQIANIAISLFDIPEDSIVPDPEDGKPGFLCCGPRKRVFDYMAKEHQDRSLYCHAALAVEEDLQVFNQFNQHCNKTQVGDVLIQQADGIPISQKLDDALVSLFHQIKTEGAMDGALHSYEPADRCSRVEEGEEGSALSIEQLTGVWVITFALAIVSLIIKCAGADFWKCNRNDKGEFRVQRLQHVDQWGNPADVDEPDDADDELEPLDPSIHGKRCGEDRNRSNTSNNECATVNQTFDSGGHTYEDSVVDGGSSNRHGKVRDDGKPSSSSERDRIVATQQGLAADPAHEDATEVA